MKERDFTSAEAKEAILPDKEKEQIDLIPEERLKEIINILLPWGYSHYDEYKYTGVSPFIGSTKNVITIVANDPEGWGSVFAICMDAFTEDEDEENSLGFYKGVMKLIAPELESQEDVFRDKSNVLGFDWAVEKVQKNAFNAVVRKENTDFAFAKTEKTMSGIWHDGKEVPHTGRIMFESTHGGFRFAYYSLESDRFDSDDECYYSGKWEHCDVKRWIYEQDLLAL